MIDKLVEYLKKPQIYSKSSARFWDDKHISKGMLEAHLNPDWDAASRKHSFIDKSVQWIDEIVSHEKYKKVIDLGCGPGLYAQRLYEKGYNMTGVDFSKRSIDYGKEKAKENGYTIKYIYKNYLEIEYDDEFDLALLIYCDFAALSDIEREIMLNKVYHSLKKGGKFIFDVFTPKNYEGKGESTSWYVNQGSGFWKAETHLCIEGHYVYEDNTRLNQIIVIDKNDNVDVYRIWNHCYTKEEISRELLRAGFINIQIYADVSGTPYDNESKTICIVAEK